MCGIAGIVDPQGVSRDALQGMMQVLRHRGPDDEGMLLKGCVGFGHRRLSIIDPETGQQPMSNADGTVWICFNGEIYNYRELRAELEPHCSFATNSDTEVILRLYERYGEACVTRLRGMFAFAIYDHARRKLFAARDHLGQKPFYYHHDADTLLFASEIKGLLAAKPALREMDPNALYEYLTVRIVAPPRSMFRAVRKLPPAHTLTFENGQVEVKRFWSLDFNRKLSLSFDEATDELERRFLESVKYHMVSDVEVGAFLSGGLDSSLIVAMMSKVSENPITTFSGDVPYERYSELPYANLVSQRFGTNHHPLTIEPSLVRMLPKQVWHLDEPSDPLSLCVYHLSELASKHLKVVLGGDGGDELFGGYDRYYGNSYASYLALLPQAVRKRVLEPLLGLMPAGFWYRSVSHKLRWILDMSYHRDGSRYAKSLSYFYFSDRYRDSLYTEKFRSEVAAFDPEGSIKQYFDTDNASELVDRMLHSDSMIRMPDHPVMIQDRMTMAHGLEARAPFLDHKLAEFCAQLPPRFKVKRNKLRRIEQELGRRHLPAELSRRKKQGFSSALPYLLADEFRTLYDVLLSQSRLVAEGILHKAAIDELLKAHLEHRADHGNRLWLLCNSEIWYRMFIDGESVDALQETLMRGSADRS
ncbi:MAG: asparagine synthase (glutamine-hydrolyzing) [bacterium]|nr:asparagine synthase (glutamine-hydrolyzing) [bacterium]